jgi:hypothetical protein
MTERIKFSVLCSLFTWTQRTKSPAKKRAKFRKFLDSFCTDRNYFPAIRLILPNLDRERGSYGLKESVLATSLIDALGLSKDSHDAVRLINWRKGGSKTGANAGNFALVAAEVIFYYLHPLLSAHFTILTEVLGVVTVDGSVFNVSIKCINVSKKVLYSMFLKLLEEVSWILLPPATIISKRWFFRFIE